MADNELDWDHAADFGETNPLLDGNKVGSSTFYRTGTLKLSSGDVRQLMNILEESRRKLEPYLEQIEETQSVEREEESTTGKCYWFRTHIFPKISKNIIFITIVLQALNVLILSLIDIWPPKSDHDVIIASAVTMIFVQLFNLVCLVYTTVMLAKQLYTRNVSTMLLAQCYLATILLFNGIYILTYRLQPSSWKFIQEDLNKNPDLVIILYIKLLFFSVSTATLCGTANVIPNQWYNYIFTSVQMLLSFVYFTSIMGQSISSGLTRPQPISVPSPAVDRRRDGSQYGTMNSEERPFLTQTLDSSLPDSILDTSLTQRINSITESRPTNVIND